MGEKTHIKGAKVGVIRERMERIRLDRIRDTFADHIADGQDIAEAAFLSGGERKDGRKLLKMIRDGLGFDMTR
jgi:hypothetical protein